MPLVDFGARDVDKWTLRTVVERGALTPSSWLQVLPVDETNGGLEYDNYPPRRITVIRIVGPVLVLAGLTGGLAAEQPSRRALRPCPAIEKPVCAQLAGRLKDYGNACEAENAGAKVIARGLCPKS